MECSLWGVSCVGLQIEEGSFREGRRRSLKLVKDWRKGKAFPHGMRRSRKEQSGGTAAAVQSGVKAAQSKAPSIRRPS